MPSIVTAVITTHNRSILLGRAIESVLSQTYPAIECIVVDDNSDDDTAEVCSAFDKVQYIHIGAEESRGGNYARNKGIKAAKGKYLAFLDDDDYWLPEKIQKQVALIEQSKAKVIYCGRRNENVENDRIRYSYNIPVKEYSGDLNRKIFSAIPTTTSALLVDKDTLIKAGSFDENLKFWQEYDLMIRLSQVTEFDFVEEPLLVYSIDQGDTQRLTNKYYPWKTAVKYICKKYHSHLKMLSLSEKCKFHKVIAEDGYLRLKVSEKMLLRIKAKMKYLSLIAICKIFK